MDNDSLRKQAPDYGQSDGGSTGPGAGSGGGSRNWEIERAALNAEVSRLQHAVAELIERSNNPKRSGVSGREDQSVKLNAAILEKDRTISGFLHERSAWEQEKSRLNVELEQLRLIAKGRLPQGKVSVESRIKDYGRTKELENQVSALQRELDLARSTARLQIQKLEKQVSEFSPAANANAMERRIASLQKELEQERDAAKHQIQRLEKQAADSRPGNSNTELERRTAALQKEWEHERAAAKLHIQRLEKQLAEPRPASSNVQSEIERVEQLILDITKIINDPAAELSTVIRKNVEIAELNAYLKGIQYSQSKGRNR